MKLFTFRIEDRFFNHIGNMTISAKDEKEAFDKIDSILHCQARTTLLK